MNENEKGFDSGNKLWMEFSKKLILSSTPVPKTEWDKEKGNYVPVIGEDGKQEQITETRIKMPVSSQYKGFIFTTKSTLGKPHKFQFDKETQKNTDLGVNENLSSVAVFEKVEYKITRTPYVLDADGNPIMENDRKKLDFEKQEVVKLTGTELKAEMDSWKKDVDKSPDAKKEVSSSKKEEAETAKPSTSKKKGLNRVAEMSNKDLADDEKLIQLATTELMVKKSVQPATLEMLRERGYDLKDNAIVKIEAEKKTRDDVER
jgi:hypothetical protein